MRVVKLKAIARERGLRGYSRLRKAELIALLRDNLQPPCTPAPRTRPPRPTRGPWPLAPWRHPKPTRAPPPHPPQAQSVRFRPDRPRQPELMRRLEGIPTPPAPRPAGPHNCQLQSRVQVPVGQSQQRPPLRPASRPPLK